MNGEGRVAIIGWGSLIWDLDDLAPKVDGGWRVGVGPVLPIEFSRVSAKRQGALTAAIDDERGAPCATAVTVSARRTVAEAVDDLAARERAAKRWIGWVSDDGAHARGEHIVEAVEAWRRDGGWAGAVWTDLASNFDTATGGPFSVASAIEHLKGLADAPLEEAARYITRAPVATDTPLRRALASDAWWRTIVQE